VKESIMNVNDKGLKVIHGNSTHDANLPRTSRIRVIAAAVGLTLLLVGGARWFHRDAGTAQEAAAQPQTATQAETGTFDYFPGQYVNQAKEAEEHIQAF